MLSSDRRFAEVSLEVGSLSLIVRSMISEKRGCGAELWFPELFSI